MTSGNGTRRGRGQEDQRRARGARPAERAARHRRGRAAGAVRAAARGHQGRRRPAAAVGRARDQDAGRDFAADAFRRDGRRRLPRSVHGDEAGHARERGRRAGEQDPVRAGSGVRRGRERDLRRALQPASARLLGPRDAPGRSGVLRHPALLHGLSHLLLPDVLDQLRAARDDRCLQALPRLSRRRHRADPARPDDRGNRLGLAEGAGVRLPERGSGVRAAVRPRHWRRDLGEAGHQPARVAGSPARNQAGHGVRARDVLAVQRRLACRAHRRGDRRDADRTRGHHALPGREAARRGGDLRHGRRPAPDDAGGRGPAESRGGPDDRGGAARSGERVGA